MGKLLGCVGCFFQSTDHILTELERNGMAPWLHGLLFHGQIVTSPN